MEGVTELVEQRVRVAPRDQNRLPGGSLHEVRIVRNNRRNRAFERLLGAVLAHPGAGSLTWACIRVEVPEADTHAPPGDLVDRDIRMVHRDVADSFEGEPVQLLRDPE